MRKKIVAVVCMIPFLLSGCNSEFPDLTDEQAKVIGEYAAVTLLKYDANSRSRLVDLSQVEEEPVAESKPEVENAPEVVKPEQEPPEAPEVTKPVEPEKSDQNTENQNTVSSMEEFLELPEGVRVSYVGYDLSRSYQEEDSLYFTIEASEGKALLMAKFELTNDSSEAREINLMDRRDNYRLTVNESYTRTTLTTLLANDLSTYMGTLEPGVSKEVVLLIEVDVTDVTDVQSISLNLKNELKTCTIQLL